MSASSSNQSHKSSIPNMLEPVKKPIPLSSAEQKLITVLWAWILVNPLIALLLAFGVPKSLTKVILHVSSIWKRLGQKLEDMIYHTNAVVYLLIVETLVLAGLLLMLLVLAARLNKR